MTEDFWLQDDELILEDGEAVLCDDCPCEPPPDECADVCSGTVPASGILDFTGVAQKAGDPCANCATTSPHYNDTNFSMTGSSGAFCIFTGSGKCGHTLELEFAESGGFVNVILRIKSGGSTVVAYEKNGLSAPIDCTANINFASTDITVNTDTQCDFSAASVTWNPD